MEKLKNLFLKIKTWLENKNIKKAGNFAIALILALFGKMFLAGVFVGFFITNNKEMMANWLNKLVAKITKKEN